MTAAKRARERKENRMVLLEILIFHALALGALVLSNMGG